MLPLKGDEGLEAARTINILTQIARAEAMQGKLNDAERTLDRAAKLLLAVDHVEPKLKLLLERGRLFALRRTPMQARGCFLEVWNIGCEHGQIFSAIDAAQMMSVVETPKQRSHWTLLALGLAERTADPRIRGWCGPLLLRLGAHYEEMLQLLKAVECFERAVSCFEHEGSPKNAWLARAAIGRTYRLQRRTPEALEILEASLRELTKTGTSLGMVFEELAECWMAQRRPDAAEQYFKRAYEIASVDEWFATNEASRLDRFKRLGKVRKAD